ncbi:hypothetical protein R69927_00752 [Paraburkholderia domus]|uniref:DUF2950 domain-containing protein n=1 Tax=Paraburkholderia domus TaxID=2793075 RepID=UPI0019128FA0|nr:DUF2950 domain-containing protein [Paraburkholderia domus]MBK5085110.1 DUF2950 domain-containing protein [Burkholderia sp. R-69927]CAE6823355.1 hypothetical protein R69927_00752 [Paraburkholderia domus]
MKSALRIFTVRLAAIGTSVALALALCLGAPSAAYAQRHFKSPEEAMNMFGDAVSSSNEATLRSLLGASFRELIPPVGSDIRSRFLKAWDTSHTIQTMDDKHAEIAVGNDGWTLPIPLVKSAQGWHFDTLAGVEEMRLRRIGRNELAVIQTMLAIYDAQREYALTDHDGSGVLAYAKRLASSPGKQDGLYWPTGPDDKPSPLGAAFLTAGTRHTEQAGYYGYHYKLLTSQGPHAPGGAFDYVADHKLFGGFAVIAWPVHYGDTGIKSFMVSHAGQVYERDLGPDGAAKAEAMQSFDPGPGWAKVSP